jgi:two-component system phosphate regulon sensor histidine kinase PhoR
MKSKHYIAVTIFALIAVVILEGLWMYLNFKSAAKDITDKAGEQMPWAMCYEFGRRSDKLTPDTIRLTKDKLSNMSFEGQVESMDDYLYHRFHSDVSLDSVDMWERKINKSTNTNTNFTLLLVDKKGTVLKTSNDSLTPYALKTKVFSIRRDKSRGIQMALNNPYPQIFERLGMLFIGSLAIVLIIVLSIWQQLRIIRRQETISRIRQDFSYAMIHNMKQPLSSIIIGINNLRSGKLDSKPEVKNKILDIMNDETTHMLNLTNRVLTISKIEENKLSLNKTHVRITPLVDDLIEKFSSKKQKSIEFAKDIKADDVFADAEYLKEAVANLVENAIKYSGESVRIDIAAFEDADHTYIVVKDNGKGISERDQKVIFDKYERAAADRQTQKVATGFGLGLNYVKQVVEAHDGRVSVKSKLGAGTIFTLYIPKEKTND